MFLRRIHGNKSVVLLAASSSQQQKEIQLLQQQINVQFEDHSLEVKKLRRELQARDEEIAGLREQVSEDTLQGYLNEIAVLKRKLESKDRLLRAKVYGTPRNNSPGLFC